MFPVAARFEAADFLEDFAIGLVIRMPRSNLTLLIRGQ